VGRKKKKMTDFIHPFESCGLGKAPFKFSHFKKLIHYSAYQIDGTPDPYCEQSAGGTCDYCGNLIKNGYFFKSSDDKVFGVGSDCAQKAFVKSKEEWNSIKIEMKVAKGLYLNAIKKADREEEERIRNEEEGRGFYTNKELNDFRMKEEKSRNEERLRLLNEKKKASKWIGSIKDKVLLTLTINYKSCSDSCYSRYGSSYFHIMTDEEGNTIVNSGSNSLGSKGDKIQVKATIKEHKTDNEGFKQTVITRAQMNTLKVIDRGVK
jgi:hypothetical protein